MSFIILREKMADGQPNVFNKLKIKKMIQNIPEILKRIASTNSSIEKKKILEETKSGLLAQIFKQAYDPFLTFGTVKIDTSKIDYNNFRDVDKEWFEELFDLLHRLEKREITGNEARYLIESFMDDTPEQWAIIIPNILKKDLRIGAGAKLINKVYANLLPESICMAAQKYDKKRVTYPVYADVKLDGVRCIAYLDDDVKLISRNGKAFKNYPFIAEELKMLGLPLKTKLDGEIISESFQSLMRTVSRKKGGIELAKDAVYNVFDVFMENTPFKRRLEVLEKLKMKIAVHKLKHVQVITGLYITNEKELEAYYLIQLARKKEGIMIKDIEGMYEFKRSYAWQKMKPEETEDLVIKSVLVGTGKYSNSLGAFVCILPGIGEVNVGSGFTDPEREEFWLKRKDLCGKMIEVKFQEKTRDGSLRFPVFMRFRPDKQ